MRSVIFSAIAALIITAILFLAAANAVPIKEEPVFDVKENTIRLRVIAASDSDADQALKYKVRDDILELAGDIFSGCTDISSAKQAAHARLADIESAAKASLQAHGSCEPITVSFGKEHCPVRRYAAFTFPSGDYYTLRVSIGKAAGKNWWCVMYPPLCVLPATGEVYADKEVFLSYGFSSEQVDSLLIPKPEIRSFFKELITQK